MASAAAFVGRSPFAALGLNDKPRIGCRSTPARLTAVAARRLSPEVLSLLSHSPRPRVRVELLHWAELPNVVLIRLAEDPSLRVRRNVDSRFEEIWQPVERYAPDEACLALVDDDDLVIQEELLANP